MEPRLKSGCIENLNLNVEIEKSHAELGLDNIRSSIRDYAMESCRKSD